MSEKPPIGVIGVGWVGLVSAACFAELGHHVWCRDIDAAKVESLRAGRVPIYEPGLEDMVTRNLERLHFELEVGPLMQHARLLFVCVDTPPTYSGDADLSRVEAVIEELPASSEHAIVMKSTVPVGTGANVVRRLGELGKGELGYGSNPEFLKEGSAVVDFMQPDRVVVGADERTPWAADEVARLYEPLDCPVVRTDVASAEMTKLASNAFLATKISFINEIANVCEEVGADVGEVAAGMGLDPRIGGSFLNAGVGYGGSCLVGEETVMVESSGGRRAVKLADLFAEYEAEAVIDVSGAALVAPTQLEVLAWLPGDLCAKGLPVSTITRRPYKADVVEVTVTDGRSVRATPDHPFVVRGSAGEFKLKAAGDLTADDVLPGTMRQSDVRGPDLSTSPGRQGVGVLERRASVSVQWIRVGSTRDLRHDGYVYSLEVPAAETFVTTGGLVVHNCFPKDVSALKQLAGNSGYHFQLLTAVIEVNELQKRRVVSKLKKHLGSLVGKKVALLGLAFKPHTDDMREASSVVLASRLQGEGAIVRAYDPVAEERASEMLTGVGMCESALDAVEGADAAVIVTEWPEFADLDLGDVKSRMANPVIVDGRNMLDPQAVRQAGFVYEGIGRL
jgi:UDP-glucose 6-dehydrogenase